MAGQEKALSLIPLLEPVGHMAWDTLRHPAYPYPEGKHGLSRRKPW